MRVLESVQQQVRRRRAHRHRKIVRVQVRQVIKRRTGGRRSGRRRTCRAPRRASCRRRRAGRRRLQLHPHTRRPLQPDRPLPVLAHFQHRYVHHHFRPRLVQVVDDLLRQQQLVRRAPHHQRILARQSVHLDLHQHVAQRRLDVVQVVLLPRIGQVERLHRLLIQFVALRSRVLGHENRVLA